MKLGTDSVETACIDSFSPATEDRDVAEDVSLALEIAKAALCSAEPEWNLPEIWLYYLVTGV